MRGHQGILIVCHNAMSLFLTIGCINDRPPNRQVLNKFSDDFSISVVGSKNSIGIHSCNYNKSHMLFSKWTLNSANLLNLLYNDLWGVSMVLLVVDVALLALHYDI